MKKTVLTKKGILLLLAAIMSFSFSQKALADDFKLSYCDGKDAENFWGGLATMGAGVLFPAEQIAAYAGSEVKKMRFYLNGTTGVNQCKVWVKDGIGGKNLIPAVNVSRTKLVSGWNEVEFTTPFCLEEGKSFFVGYTLKLANTSVRVVGALKEGTPNGMYFISGTQCDDFSDQGTLCIEAVIDYTPTNKIVGISNVYTDSKMYAYGQSGTCSFTFSNMGLDISSAKFKLQCGTMEPIYKTVEGLENFNAGSKKEITMDFVAPSESYAELPVTVSIEEVDGEPYAPTAISVASTPIQVLSRYFERNVVIEEGTGAWCGWCIRGIVAMEQMNEKYPDTFVGIAVHSGDGMELTNYINYMGLSGFPSCNLDRKYMGVEVGPEEFEYYYDFERQANTFADIALSGDIEGNNVNAKADVVFTAPAIESDFRVVYVVVEDGVTGYTQSNNYAGGSSGPMGGYENKPSSISDQVYNDVARIIYPSYHGNQGSVPANVEADVAYRYEQTFALPSKVQDKTKLSLVALLLNGKTGEIVQAKKMKLADSSDAINAVKDDSKAQLALSRKGNVVSVSGVKAGETVRVFDANGRQVAEKVAAGSEVNLVLRGNGVYVISTNTGKTAKMVF